MRSFSNRRPAALLLAAIIATPAVAHAQVSARPQSPEEWTRNCERSGRWNDADRFCEVRDSELPGSLRRIAVDARRNGGITVRGWDRNTILVRAKIQTQARSVSAARELASALRIRTDGGTIGADGPSTGSRESWSVSYEVWVPRATDYEITAESYNGGVTVADVGGRIRAETHNGGLRLTDVAGDVQARTRNGGVRVSLSGRQWSGSGLDVETRNGGVTLDLPANYGAHLEAATTNGSMRVEFPITVQGRIGKSISSKIGAGGPPVRVRTTNGGVTVRRS